MPTRAHRASPLRYPRTLPSFSSPSRRQLPESPAVASPVPMPAFPLKVLLAEDNLLNQAIIRRLLASMGFHDLQIANKGREALELVGRVGCSAVWRKRSLTAAGGLSRGPDGHHGRAVRRWLLRLTPRQMPEMNSLEAARKIRATRVVHSPGSSP